MNRLSVIISSTIHLFLFAFLFVQSDYRGKKDVMPASYPSTVPVDVSVVSHVSRSPVSRPRSDQSGIHHQKSVRSKGVTAQKKKKKEAKKKKTTSSKKRPPLKKESSSPKKVVTKKKIQDPVKGLIEKVAEQDEARVGKDSFLKNLDSQRGGDSETPVTDPDSDSDYGAPEVGPMAIGLLDKVQKILEKEWRVPFTLKGGPLKVVLVLHMKKDGTICKASVLENQSTTYHPSYQMARHSAMKAVARFYRTPLPFPASHYSQWKVFEFAFVREEGDQ